jgi:transcription initiation factor TFIIH subunit 2
MFDALESFIRSFFFDNPLSQLGLLVAVEGRARVLSELSASPEQHIQAMRQCTEQGGDFSLQNALDLARDTLSEIPPYGSREVLMLLSALSTVDPGDVALSVDAAQAAHLTCSLISLAAELYIATLLATTTGGTCNVALNRAHLDTLLQGHVPPLRRTTKHKQARKWIHMGFPEQTYATFPSLCAWYERYAQTSMRETSAA